MKKTTLICMLSALVIFAMLILAVAGRSRFPLVNRAVATVLLPAENVITSIGRAGDGIRGYWRALTVLQGENEQLKRENEELRRENINAAAMYAENRQLHALLDYKELQRNQTLLGARVIARNFGNLRDSVYIDAGAAQGLRREMPVISGGALTGIVDEVYEDYARVLLVTSSRCKIGARVLRASSRAVGIVSGRSAADGQLVMEYVFRDASIARGDTIVTSGLSGNHPENILIGVVSDVRLNSLGLLQEARVTPSANIDAVEQVMVVTKFTPQIQIDTESQGGQAQ